MAFNPERGSRTIRVLIVDDSPVSVELLSHILSSDREIVIAGIARNGEEAIAATGSEMPDVVTMDITMPGLSGFETTRRMMETRPVPIIIVSSVYDRQNVLLSLRAVEAGALTILEKPPGLGHPDHSAKARELIQTVKAMSEVKVVTRRSVAKRTATPVAGALHSCDIRTDKDIRLIAIGASTGGPIVLQEILTKLPRELPVPIVAVQHITKGYAAGLAEWLNQTTGFTVKLAEQGERLTPGCAYIAPDNVHMEVDYGDRARLTNDPPVNHLRPAVARLFSSVERIYGAQSVAVLLTGMGNDGAKELKMLRDRGATTIAQNSESSIVHGMPGEAIRLGGAAHILPPDRIAFILASLVMKGQPGTT
jgi:two-component system chemotaxis response regulator CheB